LLRDGEPKRPAGGVRDEKLQNDAILLKKLNSALTSFTNALGDVASQNEVILFSPLTLSVSLHSVQRIAAQLEQTEALLNKYVAILSGSEQFARLILDDQWEGGEAVSAPLLMICHLQ
jgi:hypothetical protein